MNSAEHNFDEIDDTALMMYLVGNPDPRLRQRVEAWISIDPANADRLADLGETVLIASEAILSCGQPRGILSNAVDTAVGAAASQPGCVIAQVQTPRHETNHQKHRTHRAKLLLAGLCALAAGMVPFAVRHFQDTQPALALAWAETVASNSAQPGVDHRSALDPDPETSSVDLPMESAAMVSNTDDAFGWEETPALSNDMLSDDPPEWLLAAVMEMDGDSIADQSLEISQ